MDTLQNTREFMQAAGQSAPIVPTTPTIPDRKLRLSLILEEAYELARDGYGLEKAFEDMMLAKIAEEDRKRWQRHNEWYEGGEAGKAPKVSAIDTFEYNPVEALDAFADLEVVVGGGIVGAGLQDVFPAARQEVFESNMSKFCTDMNEAANTSVACKEKGIETAWFARGGKWVVTRFSDGKILKNLNYRPANLAPLLEPVSHV